MKKFLFFSYIATVLFVSTNARATVLFQIPAQVEHVYIDPSTQNLTITGNLPNPCSSVGTLLVQNQNNPQELELMISAVSAQDMICFSVLKPFREVVMITNLVHNLQLEINPELIYVIKANGFEFEIPGSNLIAQ